MRTVLPLAIVIIAQALTACGNLQRTSWQPTEPPSGSELHVIVDVGGCDSFDTVAVLETAEDVTLKALIDKGAKSSCDSILRGEPHTVTLREPIGARPLLGCNPADAVYKLAENISNEDCATAVRSVATP